VKQYLAAGKCFKCAETGHLSWNCLHRESVASNHPNKLPGISSHHVKVHFNGFDGGTDVSSLAETTEIPIARVGFGSLDSRHHDKMKQQTVINEVIAE
jgi:hypothetical protein